MTYRDWLKKNPEWAWNDSGFLGMHSGVSRLVVILRHPMDGIYALCDFLMNESDGPLHTFSDRGELSDFLRENDYA